MQSWKSKPISLALLATLLAGCAAPVSTHIAPSAQNVAKFDELSDLQVVATLEKNLSAAKTANMPFMAPHYFKEASEVLSACQTALGNKPKAELVQMAAKGDAILDKGHAVMAIVQYRFVKELALKAELESYDAAKLLPADYESAMTAFSRLIEKVEREQAENIDKDKEALINSLQALVIKSVQEGALRESEKLNAESRKLNAEVQVPLTYAEAMRIHAESKAQIAAAYRDKVQVQRLGAVALFAARHAQQVNTRVALLQSQVKVNTNVKTASNGTAAANKTGDEDKVTLEKIVLEEESRLHSIAQALGMPDLRDRPLETQVIEITRMAQAAANEKGAVARVQAAEDKLRQAQENASAQEQSLQGALKQVEALSAQVRDQEEQLKAMSAKAVPAPVPVKPVPSQPAQPKAAKSKVAAPAKK